MQPRRHWVIGTFCIGVSAALLIALALCLQLDSSQPATSSSHRGDRVRTANVTERVRYLTSTKTLFCARVRPSLDCFQGASHGGRRNMGSAEEGRLCWYALPVFMYADKKAGFLQRSAMKYAPPQGIVGGRYRDICCRLWLAQSIDCDEAASLLGGRVLQSMHLEHTIQSGPLSRRKLGPAPTGASLCLFARAASS